MLDPRIDELFKRIRIIEKKIDVLHNCFNINNKYQGNYIQGKFTTIEKEVRQK